MAPPAATAQSPGFLQKWWGARVSLGISLGISVIFLLLYYSVLLSERTSAAANVLRRFELSTVDTRFLLRQKLAKPSPDPRIVIVEIDQKAQEVLGRWPFSRKYFADMLDVLRADGARVVGFDATFSKPDDSARPIRELRERLQSSQKEGEPVDPRVVAELARIEGQYNVDQQFADSIRRFGRVVLGNFFFMSAQEAQTLDKETIERYAQIIGDFPFPQARTAKSAQGQQSYIRMMENYDELGTAPVAAEANLKLLSDALAAGHGATGFFNVFADPDGVVRKGTLALPFGLSTKKTEWDLYASLDVQIVRSYLDLSNDRIILSFGENGIENIEFGSSDVVQPDDVGRVNINYRGPARTFPYTSIADVVSHKFTPGTFKDKIVLVGASAVGIADLRTTPFSAFNYPGVEIHANIVDNILNQRFLEKETREFLFDVGFILLFGLPLGLWLATAQPVYLPATLFLWIPFGAFVQYTFHRGWLLNASLPALTLLTNTLAVALYRVLIEEKEKRKLRGTFQQYVSPEVIRRLMANPDSVAPRKQEITILFSDIRGFTSISEKLDAQVLANVLNEYLTEMTRIIFRNQGTLDKYIGDAVMAFWGAPFEDTSQASRAARAAFDMLQKLEDLNRGWATKGLPRLDIGVGINKGVASAGIMGSSLRAAYTALGDSVNLASRLEGLNKEYGTRVLLTDFAYKDARVPEFLYREVDIIRVKGKEQPVIIHELAGLRDQKDIQEKVELYGRARAFYKRRDWRQASAIFQQLLARWPTDGPAGILSHRCEEFLLEEPDDQWDGVYVMKHK
ncbi:MAG TPA: adenylate/guanylate cyclase domain-containing protein [Candidatus Acidoferrales bacterium]|nr:adenylate/guanylate cyclase domain-containing protein [Candidatus Acidoferrales bacterium]